MIDYIIDRFFYFLFFIFFFNALSHSPSLLALFSLSPFFLSLSLAFSLFLSSFPFSSFPLSLLFLLSLSPSLLLSLSPSLPLSLFLFFSLSLLFSRNGGF